MQSFGEFFHESVDVSSSPTIQRYVDSIKIVDGVRTIDGGVYISGLKPKLLPFKNVHVTGDFYCAGNELTSLDGAPAVVGGDFYVAGNKLTSLEGVPTTINGEFSCSSNQLTSLEGAPNVVGGEFYCLMNPMITALGNFKTQAKKYSFDNFTDEQVKQHVERQLYSKHVKTHQVSSGDVDVDQAFDDILDAL